MVPVDSQLIELIGVIYDAVLDPSLWHEALDRIRGHFKLHNAMMGLTRLGYEPTSVAIAVNIPELYLTMQGAEYTSEILRLWGGPEQVSRYPIEEPVSVRTVSSERDFATNKYYLDFGAPQELDDMVAVVLTRDRELLVSAEGLDEPPPALTPAGVPVGCGMHRGGAGARSRCSAFCRYRSAPGCA